MAARDWRIEEVRAENDMLRFALADAITSMARMIADIQTEGDPVEHHQSALDKAVAALESTRDGFPTSVERSRR